MKPHKPPITKIKFIEPMYAILVSELPEGKDWLYEVKFEGYHCLAGRESSTVNALVQGVDTSSQTSSRTSPCMGVVPAPPRWTARSSPGRNRVPTYTDSLVNKVGLTGFFKKA
jgi:bifunctional non-homologous end joining protein LigD